MLLGFTLRRVVRSLVIAVAALGLATGAGAGLAAPAYADTTGFSGNVSPYDQAQSTMLSFSGDLEAGSTLTSVSVMNAGRIEEVWPNLVGDADASPGVCIFEAGWSCDWESGGWLEETRASPLQSFIIIEQQDADGTTSQDILTFDVTNSETDESGPDDAVYPVEDYQFTPGAVSTTVAPPQGTEDQNVGTTFYRVTGTGEGQNFNYAGGCPAGVDDSPNESTTPLQATPGSATCTGLPLPAGLYNAESDDGGLNTDSGVLELAFSAYTDFTVPTAPRLSTATRNSNGTVTITGTGGVRDQNVEVLNGGNTGTPLCTASALRGATWSCTSANALGDGTYSFTAVNQDVDQNLGFAEGDTDAYAPGGLSAQSAAVTLTVGATTPSGGGTTDVTPDWTFTITGDLTDLHPGDTITIAGSGLPAGTTLDSILHSVPTDLGTVVAAADGSFTQTVTIPQDVVIGDHTIQVTASGPGLVTTTKSQPVTVTALPTSGSGGTATITKPHTGVHNAGSDANGNTTAIQPNILTKALTPIADVAVHPSKIISAIEIGLVLLLLAVLPAHLLNATIAEQSDRFERRFKRLPKRPQWVTSLIAWFSSAPVVAGLVVTLATAILFGFADPTFGFTLASLRLILACGIALFLVGYVANALTAVIARNQWHITVLVSTRPYGLILTVVGVLISRLLHFSPGFLIGLILGLTIQGKSASGFAWRTVATRTSIVLLMSIAAWIGYSTLTLGGNEGGTFGTALLVETFVAITTEGVVALLVELLPLRFLEGERLYAHSRVLWGVLYLLTVVVFVLAVVPWEGNWDALGSSLWIWVVVLAVFAAICVGIYVYFRRFAKPLDEDEGSEEVSLGETVGSDK
jgi:hypothetical protein